MLHIKANTIAAAWRMSLVKLYNEGKIFENGEIFRDSTLTIEVKDVYSDLFDDTFPMTQGQVEAISHYLTTGEGEEDVIHEWTKLYRKRLFDNKPNQIEKIIEYLTNKLQGKRAQASIWDSSIDFTGNIAPCLQVLWFQVVDEKLDVHVHMRASDCYGKLLMNMHEFTALQKAVAEKLGREAGIYKQFIDTCHFNMKDKPMIDNVVSLHNR
mgnify:CR=1 FL=1